METTKLQWIDSEIGNCTTTKLGVLKLSVEWEGAMHPKGSQLPTGYRVKVSGYKARELKNLFSSQDTAKVMAERLLWKIVNEMHQELSQYSWDTHNKEEVKWVVR